ncbi:MAG: hypothetical protein EZS28_052016 [Streblomastix strix]|uniref:Uncharacterized protein n=1 Tax=Streblomastix strix TaxID=222440 RepID=A0A5J4SR69_9EUKA|nr:MAG: hypothetical protein EZS28_052016 [Streblomastix strix]
MRGILQMFGLNRIQSPSYTTVVTVKNKRDVKGAKGRLHKIIIRIIGIMILMEQYESLDIFGTSKCLKTDEGSYEILTYDKDDAYLLLFDLILFCESSKLNVGLFSCIFKALLFDDVAYQLLATESLLLQESPTFKEFKSDDNEPEYPQYYQSKRCSQS